MAIVMMFALLMFLFAPTIYMVYFSKLELSTCFVVSQCFYIFANTVYFLQALRLNLEVGISDLAVYCFSHIFTETLEKMVTMFPTIIFVAQITAPGVESTMGSFGSTIGMMKGMFKSLSGVIVNISLFNVSRDSINDYYKLALVEVIGCCIPLLYMVKMLPTNAEVKAVHEKHLSKIEEGHKAKEEIPLEHREMVETPSN